MPDAKSPKERIIREVADEFLDSRVGAVTKPVLCRAIRTALDRYERATRLTRAMDEAKAK